RRDVVHDPECASLGGRNEIAVANLKIGDRHHGKIRLQTFPFLSIVERHVRASLRTGVEQTAAHGVRAHDAHLIAIADAVHELGPGATVVRSPVDLRGPVTPLVAVVRHVRGAGLERRYLDCIDEAGAKSLGRDIRPAVATIASELHQAVVGADPDRVGVARRWCDVIDSVVDLAARAFIGDRRAARTLVCLLVTREVGADRGPVLAAIARSEQNVAAVIDEVARERRGGDRRAPVEAILLRLRRGRKAKRRILHDASLLLCYAVEFADRTLITSCVQITWIRWIERDVRALAAAYGIPVRSRNTTMRCRACDRNRRVVLLRSVYPVRILSIGIDAVDLSRRLVVL